MAPLDLKKRLTERIEKNKLTLGRAANASGIATGTTRYFWSLCNDILICLHLPAEILFFYVSFCLFLFLKLFIFFFVTTAYWKAQTISLVYSSSDVYSWKSDEVNYLAFIVYLSFLPHTNVAMFQSCWFNYLFIYLFIYLFTFSAVPASAKVLLKRKRKDILAADNPDVRTRVRAYMCMCVWQWSEVKKFCVE